MMASYKKGQATKLSNNFSSTEFDCHGKGCCEVTYVNPKLVEYLQKIREHFGKPITITSGYRCYTHNKNVGGANGSRHTKGDAADIVVSGVSPREVAKYAESIGVKGIGLYETQADGYFTHIDTRDSKSFWYGQKEEPRTTFGGTTTTTNNSTTSSSSIATNKITVSLPTLQIGAKGKYVKMLQALLEISIDGFFGNQTQTAVYNYQKNHKLTVDKVVGKATWTSLM